VAGITASSEEFGTELPDQFEEVDQLVLVAPVQVLVAANKLEFEMMAIAIKIEILIDCFIILYIYVYFLHFYK
jgi:hypothetical protein